MTTKQLSSLMGAKPSTTYKYLTKFTKELNRELTPRELGILIAKYLIGDKK